MPLTENQHELLLKAWAYAHHPKGPRGFVVEPEAQADADFLADRGWLERQTLANGDHAYFWTPAAESLLDVSKFTDAEARDN